MKTLLIDLDDTLLTTNLDRFIKTYFMAFAKHVGTYGIGGAFLEALWAGTQQMIQNNHPDRTLKETFEATFYPLLYPSLPSSLQNDNGGEVVCILEEFYEKIFPELRQITEMRPEAINLIDEALNRGYRIAIATNPLFPKTATHQRLEWAGLPIDNYPFELISTYEEFHFTKPNPAYFAEVLAYLGYPDGEIIMIGNDLNDDIRAAQRIGLPTFWVKPLDGFHAADNFEPTMTGNLSEVFSWLDSINNDQLIPKYTSLDAINAILLSTPASLLTICHKLPIDRHNKMLEENARALHEILCHLRDVETEIYLPNLYKICCDENMPFLPIIYQKSRAGKRDDINQDLQFAINAFVQLRQKTLNLIGSIKNEDMEQEGIHDVLGNVTLFQLISKIAEHDREHIHQVYDVLHKNHIRVLARTCNSD